MDSKYQIFDAARVDLTKGVNLVEASAGTGKTYAIGMLVLRALVELGETIDKILIVTFTKAATEELKSRIRARLVEARDIFGGAKAADAEKLDRTLLDWIATVADHRKAFNRLQLALYDIDRAGIFTIHGFCQRMLVEQALESGQLFEVELLADISHVTNMVADDFWRNHLYSLAPLPCSLVSESYASPKQLLAGVGGVVGKSGRIEPEVGTIEEVLDELQLAMEKASSWWSMHSKELHHAFTEGMAEGSFKKQFSENFDNWFEGLDAFFSGESVVFPDNLDRLVRRSLSGELNGSKIRGEDKKEAYLADWPLPDQEIDCLIKMGATFLLTLRVKLAWELRRTVCSRLEKEGAMSFDELILRLSKALQGDGGRSLKKNLQDRFKVALIDEFQDTDSEQWHIFSSIFGDGEHYLYLIGDPKQAIYKFRGADIHSYFLARERADRFLTLEKNYRSHPHLVNEVNRLFSTRKDPFFYEEKTLDYRVVSAAKNEGDLDLLIEEKSMAGMVYCQLERDLEDKKGRWSPGAAATAFRRHTVTEIAALLDRKTPVMLQTTDEQLSPRPLAPQDIAILVRSNRQAEEYRQALASAKIPAVVGSRQSVYQTKECTELFFLLQAIAAPAETGLLKTAMAVSWFGLSGNSLQQIWQDEEQLSGIHGRFLLYNQLWQEKGFLVMMNTLLIEEQVLPTLASGQFAERSIANMYHLLELIQEEENTENLGMAQILQWLQKAMKDGRGGDNVELLLESDEESVRIVTMHSAKGLEYPVVFCPYLWYGSSRVTAEKDLLNCHDDAHQQLFDLGSELFDERKGQVAREEMAEDVRLVYVALTRAKIRCYVSWADVKSYGNVKDSFDSALGYLLFSDGKVDFQEQTLFFSKLAAENKAEFLKVSADLPPPSLHRMVEHMSIRALQPTNRSLHTDWQMSSYSAMASLSEYEYEDESDSKNLLAGNVDRRDLIPVPNLPAGAQFGNVIHDLLEALSFSSIGLREEQQTMEELIHQKCRRYGVQAHSGDVKKLLELVVKTVVTPENLLGSEAGGSFSLSMLSARQCLKEMGFYFHLGHLETSQINAVLEGEPTVVPLNHKTMRGYLTGFVDLCCEHDGKYYILDYKTNFLGELMADYQPENLVTAMQSHNYGLQYWIYTLVLHRHLINMLPGYRYERHFGGVRYLFVRGMNPEIPGSGVYATLPDYEKLRELDRAIGVCEND